MSVELEQKFQQAVLASIEEMKRSINYNPARYSQLVHEQGGVQAVRTLLYSRSGQDAYSKGLETLWEAERLDLSAEALVLKPEFAELFSDADRAQARRILAQYRYTPPGTDGPGLAGTASAATEGASDTVATQRATAGQPPTTLPTPPDVVGRFQQVAEAAKGIEYDLAALAELVERFKALYVSFESQEYREAERNYKLKAAHKAQSLLSSDKLGALIDQARFEDAKSAIKHACYGNNLLNQWDIRPVLDTPAEPLARTLYNLLYGDAPFEQRFDAWGELLGAVKPQCWPAATYFLMLHDPEKRLFVKPSPYRSLLDALETDIDWEVRPTAAFYAELQRLGEALRIELSPLGARDMIDVQSFIWVVQDEAEESEWLALGSGARPPLAQWQAQLRSSNAMVHRVARDYPQWLQTTFGAMVDLDWEERWLQVNIGDGMQGLYFNPVRSVYAFLTNLDTEDTQLLKDKLSNRLREPTASRPSYRFFVNTEADYEALKKITRRMVERVSVEQTAWPDHYDVPTFAVIHGDDDECQRYGESYCFSLRAAGDARKLHDALTAMQQGGPPVRLVIYRPTPRYEFTAWARVREVSAASSPSRDGGWRLTLDHHEFPVALNLKGNAAHLMQQVEWLRDGLKTAFNYRSIRLITAHDFEQIITTARAMARHEPAHERPRQSASLTLDPNLVAPETDMPITTLTPETKVWRIHFPHELWDEARQHGVIGISWPTESTNQSVNRFKTVKVGDRVVAYVQGGAIGGVGVVTHPYVDIRESPNAPFPPGLFGGDYPQRIGVAWTDALPTPVNLLDHLKQDQHTPLYNRLKNPNTVAPLSHQDYVTLLMLLRIDDVATPPTETRLPDAWPSLARYRDLILLLDDDLLTGDQLRQQARDYGEGFNEAVDAEDLIDHLRQLRLIKTAGDGQYARQPYITGDETALLRLMALALLVPVEGSPGAYTLPARSILTRLEGGVARRLDEFAPELGADGGRLLAWYAEAGLVDLNQDGWRPTASALNPLPGADSATRAYNEFLNALRAERDGALVSDLSQADGPLPPATDFQAALAELGEDLLIDDQVVRRIYRSLLAGRHIVLTGPPGTGKTELACRLPSLLWREPAQTLTQLTTDLDQPPVITHAESRYGYATLVVTATEDWGVRDVIGGIGPKLHQDKTLTYDMQYGVLTRAVLAHYERVGERELPAHPDHLRRRDYIDSASDGARRYRGVWLVIDEFTRAPIDAALGGLLTTLSGSDSAFLAVPKGDGEHVNIRLPADFRIIGTLNSFDRHFLHQMSEALKRRFDFIDVLPPSPADADYEHGIAVARALRHLRRSGLTQITAQGDPPTYCWHGVIAATPLPLEQGARRYTISGAPANPDDPVNRALQSFRRLFGTIRVFRQLGTAQMVTLYTNLFTGHMVGMSWEAALDTALADTLVDQLQVMTRDEQRMIEVFVEYAGNSDAFVNAIQTVLKEAPEGRRRTLLRQFYETDRLHHAQTDIDLRDVSRLTESQFRRLFTLGEPLALPPGSLFRQRLSALSGERGV